MINPECHQHGTVPHTRVLRVPRARRPHRCAGLCLLLLVLGSVCRAMPGRAHPHRAVPGRATWGPLEHRRVPVSPACVGAGSGRRAMGEGGTARRGAVPTAVSVSSPPAPARHGCQHGEVELGAASRTGLAGPEEVAGLGRTAP